MLFNLVLTPQHSITISFKVQKRRVLSSIVDLNCMAP